MHKHEIWRHLHAEGLVPEASPPEDGPPWLIVLAQGFGALVSTVFMLVFVAAVLGGQPLIAGLFGLIMSLVIHFRISQFRTFVDLLCAFLALAGLATICFGVAEIPFSQDDKLGAAMLSAMVVTGATFPLLRLYLYHLMSCGLTYALIAFWLWDQHGSGFFLLLPALTPLVVVGLWLRKASLAPIVHSLILGETLLLWFGDALRISPAHWHWVSSAIILAAILFFWKECRLHQRQAAYVVIIGCISALTGPGSCWALLLILVAIKRGESWLLGLGTAAFAVFLADYYYDLALPLNVKAYRLLIVGFVLIMAAWAWRRHQGQTHD